MDSRWGGSGSGGNQHHSIGLSSHKNEFRRGVCLGNYAEELLAADYRGRPGFVLDQGGAFAAETTSRAAYAPAPGKSGEELAAAARRQDIFLKHVKYGKSAVMPTDKTGFFASTSQLSYEGAGGAAAAPAADLGAAGGPQAGGRAKVQDCLWGASKFDNRKVPLSVHAHTASEQRRRQLEAEAAASPYRTVEKEMIESAARDGAARAAARQPMAHPRDAQGEDTSVGRKPTGQFSQLFDKDFNRIGLRKP